MNDRLQELYIMYTRIASDDDKRIQAQILQKLALQGIMADFTLESGDPGILNIIAEAGRIDESVIDRVREYMRKTVDMRNKLN